MITGIYFLSSKDFSLKESIEGKLLSLDNDIKGIQLVLFYSNTCEFCDNVMKEFKKLPEKVMGCSFSMINVNHNNDVVQLSKQTVSPLTYVPELILFIDNLPYIKYEGDPTIDEIQKFIRSVSNTIEKNSFVQTNTNNKVDDILAPALETSSISNNLLLELDQPVSKKSKKVCYLQDDTFICT
jgi:thioredoxin-like negative regulator of GroEL